MRFLQHAWSVSKLLFERNLPGLTLVRLMNVLLLMRRNKEGLGLGIAVNTLTVQSSAMGMALLSNMSKSSECGDIDFIFLPPPSVRIPVFRVQTIQSPCQICRVSGFFEPIPLVYVFANSASSTP